jgi:hypothetical protein
MDQQIRIRFVSERYGFGTLFFAPRNRPIHRFKFDDISKLGKLLVITFYF